MEESVSSDAHEKDYLMIQIWAGETMAQAAASVLQQANKARLDDLLASVEQSRYIETKEAEGGKASSKCSAIWNGRKIAERKVIKNSGKGDAGGGSNKSVPFCRSGCPRVCKTQ